MYFQITGKVLKVNPAYVVIDNNGIGYQIIVANPFKYHVNDIVTVYTYHYVREDIFNLYGFMTEEAKELFIRLISVNGVGPKTALSIMATDNIGEVITAIETGDVKLLTKFPGIGNKTAQQIILDLKGKLVIEEDYNLTNNLRDAEEALLALGYKKADVKRVLKNMDQTLKVEEIIKQALKNILK